MASAHPRQPSPGPPRPVQGRGRGPGPPCARKRGPVAGRDLFGRSVHVAYP
ncbi:hypothetical protein MGSAQ_000219 [marine sediment metagenome]|uniref:Uncharacterized protein n=1 Tax=marine sediment metagenome TaxID=412755 RepID=A0A1B6NY13_9ZZZZ